MIRPSGACSDTMQSRLCGRGSDIHGHDGVRHKPMRGLMTVGTQRLVNRTSVSNFPESLELDFRLEHLKQTAKRLPDEKPFNFSATKKHGVVLYANGLAVGEGLAAERDAIADGHEIPALHRCAGG